MVIMNVMALVSQGKTTMACLSIPARVQERKRAGRRCQEDDDDDDDDDDDGDDDEQEQDCYDDDNENHHSYDEGDSYVVVSIQLTSCSFVRVNIFPLQVKIHWQDHHHHINMDTNIILE